MLADVSGILTLRKVINHGNPRWRATARVNGRRRQRFFRTKEEGQGWLIEAHRQHPCEQFWKALPLAEKQRVMLAYQSGENKGAASDLRPVTLAESRLPLPPCQRDAEPTAADPQADQVEVKAAGGGIR